MATREHKDHKNAVKFGSGGMRDAGFSMLDGRETTGGFSLWDSANDKGLVAKVGESTVEKALASSLFLIPRKTDRLQKWQIRLSSIQPASG